MEAKRCACCFSFFMTAEEIIREELRSLMLSSQLADIDVFKIKVLQNE